MHVERTQATSLGTRRSWSSKLAGVECIKIGERSLNAISELIQRMPQTGPHHQRMSPHSGKTNQSRPLSAAKTLA